LERSKAPFVPRVHVGAVVDEETDDIGVTAIPTHQVEGSNVIPIQCVHVGSSGEEETYDVNMT